MSERARQRAAELANDADLRRKAPPSPPQTPNAESRTRTVKLPASEEPRVPLAGGSIVRVYEGRTLEVNVLPNGFEGEIFKSLSAVAKHITGSHCNGYLFFRLKKRGGDE